MQIFFVILGVFAIVVLLVIYTQHKLVILDENVSNAMSQIGVQLSGRYDALTALLILTKDYARQESAILFKTIQARRNLITAKSTPDEVQNQEGVIAECLERVVTITQQYPELKVNQTYIKTMDAVRAYENMVRTSRMIYNDCVAKLNRELRMFPISIISRLLGFSQRNFLEEKAAKTDSF